MPRIIASLSDSSSDQFQVLIDDDGLYTSRALVDDGKETVCLKERQSFSEAYADVVAQFIHDNEHLFEPELHNVTAKRCLELVAARLSILAVKTI